MAKLSGKKNIPKKITYSYETVDAYGKKILGEIEADSLLLAKALLRKGGILPKKIKRKAVSLFQWKRKKKIKSSDITIFSRQMATMLNAGVPLAQSLNIVAKGTDNPSVQELVTLIKNDIEAGQHFSESLRKYPKYFDLLY